ncbi:unnamed protein product [Calypogeia fissa]
MNNFPVRATRNFESNPMGSLNPITASVWRQSLPMVGRLNRGTLSGHLGNGLRNSPLSVHHNCHIICLYERRLQQPFRIWPNRQLFRRRQNENSKGKLSPGSLVLPERLVVRCDAGARGNGSHVRRLILWGNKPPSRFIGRNSPKETVIDEVLSQWRPGILIWNKDDEHAAKTREIMIKIGHWDQNKPERTDIWKGWDLEQLKTLLDNVGRIDTKVDTIMIMATEIRELELVTSRLVADNKMPFQRGKMPFVAVLESCTKGPWAEDKSLSMDGEWQLKYQYMPKM